MSPQDTDERERNQKALRDILETYGLTQKKAAGLITEQSYRPVDARTFRSWLAPASAVSSRPCPLWALEALKRAIQKLKPNDQTTTP